MAAFATSSDKRFLATVVNVQTYSGSWGSEVSWDLVEDATGAILLPGSGYCFSVQLTMHISDLPDPGSYTLNMYDSFGDGWNVVKSLQTSLTQFQEISRLHTRNRIYHWIFPYVESFTLPMGTFWMY